MNNIPHPTAALTVGQLVVHYGSVVALSDVSFDVTLGTIVALLGASGSGKTTVLRALLGEIEPSSGDIRFGQGATLAPVGAARSPRERLQAAWATAFDAPHVLLLDQPSRGLDPEGVRRLDDALRRYVDAGNSVLLSAPVPTRLKYIADHAVILDDGHVVTQGSVAELLAGAARTSSIRVSTPRVGQLAATLAHHGHACVHLAHDTIRVHDMGEPELLQIAAQAGAEITDLATESPDLESLVAAFVERSQSFSTPPRPTDREVSLLASCRLTKSERSPSDGG